MTKSRICGHGLELADQAGRPLRAGRDLVALKIMKVVAIRARTIKEQEKLTPRSIIFAMRTRVLTFYRGVSAGIIITPDGARRRTKSLACSLSVSSSCFSRICSSRKVGLSGLSILPGVPGVLRADLRPGDKRPFELGCRVACCSTGSLEM